MQSESRVATEKASAYLKQLCRHFKHKVPAEFDDARGFAQFAMGTCELLAEDGLLVMRLEAETAEALDKVKYIVSDHLVRFGFRENIQVEWTDLAVAGQ